MFGQLVHQTIEDIHQSVLTGDTKKVTDKNINAWFEDNYSSLSQSSKTYLGEAQKKAK